MVNKPKNIGTATETAVVRYLRENGFPNAERRALAGAVDLGDIVGTPGIVWEVKGGKAAETASDAQIEAWLAETETERRNADEGLGVLVTKRKAVGSTRVGDWWAWLSVAPEPPAGSPGMLTPSWGDVTSFPVRMRMVDLMFTLFAWGLTAPRAEDAA